MGTDENHPTVPSVRTRFAVWRSGRPFWGGLWTIVGALELLVPTLGPLEVRILQGVAGLGTIVLAVALIALAAISWTHIELRPITGVFIVLGGLASYVVSNLGGFLIGMILIVLGGSLIFAWGPRDHDPGTVSVADSPSPDSDDGTATATAGDGTATSRRLPAPGLKLACAVVAVALTLMPSAAAASSTQDPWWPPLPWPPEEEQAEPEESEEDPHDGDDSPDPGAPECDPHALPQRAPEIGSAQAESDAAAVAACWESDTGSRHAESRDLPSLAEDPPVLVADSMAMEGLDFNGVVTVPTERGRQPAMEFTMDDMRLEGMDQSAAIGGTNARLRVANPGSAATLSGDVRLYAQRVEGKLFGAVPVTLTPESPPPVMVPELVVTDVTTDFYYVRGDAVDLPDLKEPVD